jgi:hypothetical protein
MGPINAKPALPRRESISARDASVLAMQTCGASERRCTRFACDAGLNAGAIHTHARAQPTSVACVCRVCVYARVRTRAWVSMRVCSSRASTLIRCETTGGRRMRPLQGEPGSVPRIGMLLRRVSNRRRSQLEQAASALKEKERCFTLSVPIKHCRADFASKFAGDSNRRYRQTVMRLLRAHGPSCRLRVVGEPSFAGQASEFTLCANMRWVGQKYARCAASPSLGDQ